MRALLLSLFLTIAVLVPNMGNAQVYSQPTQPPEASAANTAWYASGNPISFAGNFYYPTGPTVFFDGKTMVRSGIFQGVPLFTDTTLEPYSMVFVPVGGNVLRPYERLRNGELTGTVGSRLPSFPIRRDSDLVVGSGATDLGTVAFDSGGRAAVPESSLPIATAGTIMSGIASSITPGRPQTPTRTVIETIPAAPKSAEGVWIEYQGAKWYHAGAAVSFDPDRFEPVGNYRGFVVYKEKSNSSDTVYVPVVRDGPLAPYVKH